MIARPATLRDLRRLVARGARLYPPQRSYGGAWGAAVLYDRDRLVYVRVPGDPPAELTVAELDRLISRLGADWSGSARELRAHAERERAEARPKGTSEVDPDAEPGGSDAVHGGDGASGEVDDPAPRVSESAANRRHQDGSGAGVEGEAPAQGIETSVSDSSPSIRAPELTNDASGALPAGPGPTATAGAPDDAQGSEPQGPGVAPTSGARGAEPHEGEATAPVAPGADPRRAEDDTPAVQRPDVPGSSDDDATTGDETADAHERPAGEGTSPRRPRLYRAEAIHSPRGWGGIHTVEDPELDATGRRAARRIARELRRLVQTTLGPLGDPTPRLDARRLVREIVGRSYRLGRVQRRESEPRIAILAVDVSGSCSSYCQELHAAADRVARDDERVAVVLHSNGIPYAWAGVPLHGVHTGAWDALLARDVGLLVWLGDGDGAHHAQEIGRRHRCRLVWLDNYCASDGPRPASRRLREAYDLPIARGDMWQGVGGARGALDALRGINRRNSQ